MDGNLFVLLGRTLPQLDFIFPDPGLIPAWFRFSLLLPVFIAFQLVNLFYFGFVVIGFFFLLTYRVPQNEIPERQFMWEGCCAYLWLRWVLPEENRRARPGRTSHLFMRKIFRNMLRVDMDDWQFEEVQLQINTEFYFLSDIDVYFTHSWSLRQFKGRINQIWYNFDFCFFMPGYEEREEWLLQKITWEEEGGRGKRVYKNPKPCGLPCLVTDSTVKVRDYLPLEI